MRYLITFCCAFVIVYAITPIFINQAKRLRFLDYPSSLKIHTKPTPLLGGLVVLIGFLFALFLGLILLGLPFSADMKGILVAGLIVIVVGLVDDKKGLSPSHKFLGKLWRHCCF